MDLQTSLTQLGLSVKEIDTYLTCLALGESAIVPITKKLGMPRSSVVYLLESLSELGLINIIQRNSRRVYLPHPPRSVLTLLKHKKQNLEEQIVSLEESLPELNNIYNSFPFQPDVHFFRGRKEIRDLYESVLEEPINEFQYISELKKIESVLGQAWLKSWLQKRIATGIKGKAIWIRSGTIKDEPLYRPKAHTLRNVRFAPENFASPTHILIYGDKVVFITTANENIAIQIKSRDLSESMRNIFRELWRVSSEK